MSTRPGMRACLLAAAVLLAGCVPVRWPEKPATAPSPVPPATTSQRPGAVKPAPSPSPAPAPAPDARLTEEAPEPLPRSKSGNPPFYEVFGERHFVLEDSNGYREQGVSRVMALVEASTTSDEALESLRTDAEQAGLDMAPRA